MVITNSGARDQGWFFSPPLMRGVKVDYQENGLSVNSRTGLLYRDLAFWFVTFFFFFPVFFASAWVPTWRPWPGAAGVLEECLVAWAKVLWFWADQLVSCLLVGALGWILEVFSPGGH